MVLRTTRSDSHAQLALPKAFRAEDVRTNPLPLHAFPSNSTVHPNTSYLMVSSGFLECTAHEPQHPKQLPRGEKNRGERSMEGDWFARCRQQRQWRRQEPTGRRNEASVAITRSFGHSSEDS